ncbi:MAG: carbohydrate binding family 9 domain-containing protein [Ignavibacterium sp.]|nr:carbohydrate binding family 9 domain-containing protein [Ignavibacterium sp.]
MDKLIPFILIVFTTFLFATEGSKNENKSLTLIKIDKEINIDGVVDDVWNYADSTTNFFQLDPYFNQPTSVKTVAKVLTSDKAIYCLMICYDDKNNIQANAGQHDAYTGDIVSMMLDTFGDKQTAYKFAVNASGVKSDSRMLDDARNRDYSWDGIWDAAAQIYDWGYVVEIRIPYKSIKYDKNLTEWGLDFDRWRSYNKEDIYWCEYEQSEGQRISKFGKLIFQDFKPTITGINLEIYPVGIAKTTYLGDNKYKFDPNAGLDVFYNPSERLTFLLTANPDFAQVEADPFSFNISRYESYFSERRPFFTEGNEVFNPSGKERSSGFYSPLELFYSRRIGKLLPGGKEVPLIFGTKAFGRYNEWEYGGFIALTGKEDYIKNNLQFTEEQAYFGSARLKKKILDNSSIGLLMVGKQTKDNTYGVIDIDGAFRGSDWQLAYQFARSFENNKGDYAASIGFRSFSKTWANLFRFRAIGNKFNINEVGFVPWKGTLNSTILTGPIWYLETGAIRNVFLYAGSSIYYEHADLYTDYSGVIGFNMQFRDGWGYEINTDYGKSKDEGIFYDSYSVNFSSWFDVSQIWSGNLWGGYQKTYNFNRNYIAAYSWFGFSASWKALNILTVGTSYDMFIENDPDGNIEDITYNARPFFSLTPINNLNFRVYVDNVFVKSTDRMERIIGGFLFSWNFLPKSWIYLAVNEFRDRSDEYDSNNNLLSNRMHTTDRAGVFKIKYLYYF